MGKHEIHIKILLGNPHRKSSFRRTNQSRLEYYVKNNARENGLKSCERD
jgi:hypothetical protein